MILKNRLTLIFALLATVASTVIVAGANAATVYTETNSVAGNAVQIYRSAPDGSLALASEVSTGGSGTDGGLGSQGALALTKSGRWLFAVNAGSNEISAFKVTAQGLVLASKVNSAGIMPISLSVHDDLLYVLNAGGEGNISGFHVGSEGNLKAIADSTRPLSSSKSGGAQVEFNHDGDRLVVTEKATNKISVYRLDGDTATGPVAYPSNGKTPFGFEFDRRGNLLVSEAFGGAPGASAISSYELGDDPTFLQSISASVPTHQSAACWVTVARHGRYAYVTNTGSGTITGFRVDRDGALTSLNADGVTGVTGGSPTDATVGGDNQTLYVLSANIGKIVMFKVQADGSIVNLGSALGTPLSAAGLVAR